VYCLILDLLWEVLLGKNRDHEGQKLAECSDECSVWCQDFRIRLVHPTH
jgi:hypothetical protein